MRPRRTLLTLAWLASWALILVFASSLPGWLAIGLAVAVFAGFLLASRERSPCIDGGACATGMPGGGSGRADPGAPRSA